MGTQLLQFVELSPQERDAVAPLAELAEGTGMELRLQRPGGKEEVVTLPATAAEAVANFVRQLQAGGRVAVLAEDREVSPAEAAAILGISRPLVVLRMDRGELPFRYVGAHRRTGLKDVLALKARLDRGQKALDALADETEDLIANYGL